MTNTGSVIYYQYEGIAAMPSLHVAVCSLYFFFFKGRYKLLGWVTGIYLCLILFGSVALGWHYLVDGYAGIFLSWMMLRLMQGLFEKTPDKEDELISDCTVSTANA